MGVGQGRVGREVTESHPISLLPSCFLARLAPSVSGRSLPRVTVHARGPLWTWSCPNAPTVLEFGEDLRRDPDLPLMNIFSEVCALLHDGESSLPPSPFATGVLVGCCRTA